MDHNTNLLGELLYDMACGKAQREDFALALELIDQIEKTAGEPQFEEKDAVLSSQAEFLYRHSEPALAAEAAHLGLAVLEAWRAAEPQAVEPDNRAALLHGLLWENTRLLSSWQAATQCLRQAAGKDPRQARWDLWFERLFEDDPALGPWQILGREEVLELYRSSKSVVEGLSYTLAHALRSVTSRPPQKDRPDLEAFYSPLIEDALTEPTFSSTYAEVSDLARFFELEAERLTRPELFDKALVNLQRLVGQQQDRYFAERSIMTCRLQKALLCQSLGDRAQAGHEAETALAYARDREAQWALDFSTQLHYAEFLLEVRRSGLVSAPPALETIRQHAQGARDKGEGFYGQPGMILVTVALEEGEEGLALHLLCQEFLLHELCLDTEVHELKSTVPARFARLLRLLDAFIAFETRARPNYYLDPAYTWPQVQTLNPDQTAAAWQGRMREILERAPLALHDSP